MRWVVTLVLLGAVASADDAEQLLEQFLGSDVQASSHAAIELAGRGEEVAPFLVATLAACDADKANRISTFLAKEVDSRAVEDVIRAGLKSSDSRKRFRCAAILALSQLRSQALVAPEVEQILVGPLDDLSTLRRVEAAEFLARAGIAREETLAAMRKLARNRAHFAEAIRIIGWLGPMAADALPELCDLAAKQGMNPGGLASCAAEIGCAAIPGLVKMLDHTDKRIRLEALSCLAGFGPMARLAREAVSKLQRDKDLGQSARMVLGAIDGTEIKSRGIHLDLEALDHEDPAIRLQGADSLRSQRPGSPFAQETANRLKKVVREEKDADVRAMAVAALSYVSGAPEAISILRDALRGPDVEALTPVLIAAMDLGEQGRSLQPDVEQLLASEEANLAAVMRYLRSFPDGLDRLLARLAQGSEIEREGIALGMRDPKFGRSEQVQRTLFDLLFDDPSERVSAAAARTLRILRNSYDGLPRVVEALKSRDGKRRIRGASAASIYPSEYTQLMPLLLPLLDEAKTRMAVIETLYRWGPRSRAALPKLRSMRKTATGDLAKALDELIERVGR